MFSYTDLHFFDKKGTEYPLTYMASCSVTFKGKRGDDAEFMLLTDSERRVAKLIKKHGGKFDTDSSTGILTGVLHTPSAKVSMPCNVEMTPIKSSSNNTIYTINNVNIDASSFIGKDIGYPSITFHQNIVFEKVSTDLIETQTVFIFGKNAAGEITRLADCPNMNTGNFRILFFIDQREQQDFRFFTVKNDEVIWTDRIEIDPTNPDDICVNIGFCGKEEGVFEENLYVCLINKDVELGKDGDIVPIGSFTMQAETEGEDERYRTFFENFGIPDPILFNDVYYDFNGKDDKMDYIALNKHSKEMFLAYDQIFPYVGTYKALINAVNMMGFKDIFFKEWYKKIGISGDTHRGFVAYDMDYKATPFSNVISNLPLEERVKLKKLNWLSMMFRFNTELFDRPTDKYGFPQVVEMHKYYNEEFIVKLIALREWLEKYVLALNCRIIDIGGEGIFFERYIQASYGGIQHNLEYGESINTIATARDMNILMDASAHIPVNIGIPFENFKIESFMNLTFEDICNGAVDNSGTYRKDIDSVDVSTSIFPGITFAGYDNSIEYLLRGSSNCENFIFGEEYIDASYPKLIIKDNVISFVPTEQVLGDKNSIYNSPFTKRPVIILENAVIRNMNNTWEKDPVIKIYPEQGKDDSISYIIENVHTGEKVMSQDYIYLIPPKYEVTDTEVNITPFKVDDPSVNTIHLNRKYCIDMQEDASIEKRYMDITTYGFRYSSNNSYGIPLFSFVGYTLRGLDFEIPQKELYIDILDGKLAFYDEKNDRNIYINFYVKNGKRKIEVNATYNTELFQICAYHNDPSTSFNNFFENVDYSGFYELYNQNPELAISLNNIQDLKVNNKGIFNIDVIGYGKHGIITGAKTSNDPMVYTPEPHLTTFTNTPTSNNDYQREGELVNASFIEDNYNPFCVAEAKVKNPFIKTDEITEVSYPVYPYENSIPDDGTVHFVNLSSKFFVYGITPLQDIEDGVGSEIELIVGKVNPFSTNRFAEKYDIKSLNEFYTGSTKTPAEVPSTAKEVLEDMPEKTNFDVNVIFYNEAGGFPVIQLPGRMINGKLVNDSYSEEEYHILLKNDVTSCYSDIEALKKTQEDNLITGWLYENTDSSANTTLMDIIPELLDDQNISVYVQPAWESKVVITFVDSERKIFGVQFRTDLYDVPFRKGEMIKLIHGIKDSSGMISQSSYKVLGYDVLGLTLILEGEISNAYNSRKNKKYAYSEIPYELYENETFNVDPTGFVPKEDEDEPWINGWLAWKRNEEEGRNRTVFKYVFEGEGGQTHTHYFKIRAGLHESRFIENKYTLWFRVYAHDDVRCTDGNYKDPVTGEDIGIFSPWYESYGDVFETDLHISYAHNIFTDYGMRVENASSTMNKVNLETEKSITNSKSLKFVDDTFRSIYRSYDIHNAIRLWMDSSNGKPYICEKDIYKYHCPVIVSEESNYIAFYPDFAVFGADEETSTIKWKVYKPLDGNGHKELLFESWNRFLFLDNEDKDIYDIELTVYDQYGNAYTRMFEGAVKMEYEIPEDTTEYTVSVNAVSEYGQDSSFGYVTGYGTFMNGKVCTLHEVELPGHEFMGWYEIDPSTMESTYIGNKSSYSFYVTDNALIEARFKPFIYTISLSCSQDGTVSISESTVNPDDPQCTEFYYGTNCTITAIPNLYEGSPEWNNYPWYDPNTGISKHFKGWYLDEDRETIYSGLTEYTFTVKEDMKFYAEFEDTLFVIMVGTNNSALGSVSSNITYATPGQECIVTATAAEHSHLEEWYEDGERITYNEPISDDPNNANPYTVGHVLKDYNFTAQFLSEIPEALQVTCKISAYGVTDPSDLDEFNVQMYRNDDTTGSVHPTLTASAELDSSWMDTIHLICQRQSTSSLSFKEWQTPAGNFESLETSFTVNQLDTNLVATAVFTHNKVCINVPDKDAFQMYGHIIDYNSEVNYNETARISLSLNSQYGINEDSVSIEGSYGTKLVNNQSITIYNVTSDITVSITPYVLSDFTPFYIIPDDDATLKLNFQEQGTNIRYSINDTVTWLDFNDSISVSKNDTIYLVAARENTKFTAGNDPLISLTSSGAQVGYSVGGNMISVLRQYGTNYADSSFLPDTGGRQQVNISPNSECFKNVFKGTALKDASDLILPSNTARYCYQGMFSNTPITRSPYLPATTLTKSCYKDMFLDCSLLNEVICNFTTWSSNGRALDTEGWLKYVSVDGIFYRNENLPEPSTYGPDTIPETSVTPVGIGENVNSNAEIVRWVVVPPYENNSHA